MPWYDPRTWFSPAPTEEPWTWPTPAPTPAATKATPPIIGANKRTRTPRRTRGWADASRYAAPKDGELRGHSGTRVHGGRIGHELNPELQGDRWPIAEREMRRTDYSVGAMWRATRDMLLSAVWCFVPGEADDEVSRMLTDEANRLFGFAGYPGRLDRPFEEALEQALLYYPVGVRCGEVRFERTPNGRIDIVDPWVDRLPESIDRWIFDEQGRWLGVVQKPPVGDLARGGAGAGPFIPADELVYLAHGVEGQAMEGCGAHRPIWDAQRRKKDIEDLAMEATERWSRGVPRIIVDEAGAAEANISRADLEAQVQKVRQGLVDWFVGDCAWFEETPWVRVEKFGGDLDPSKALQQIEALDGATKGAVLLQWLNLGTTPTGSRSVGQVHRDLWIASLVQVLDRVAAAYNGCHRPGGGVIGRWVELNWSGIRPEQYPRLEHAGLAVDPLADAITAGVIDRLTAAGWLDPDDQADRDRVRHRIGLALQKVGKGPAISRRPDGADPATDPTPATAPEVP
ncbi:MAG: hypothetical protein H6705_16685 [Myxococcales bacterium]|nr:hypothetical protein [Myxococcales bacterium]